MLSQKLITEKYPFALVNAIKTPISCENAEQRAQGFKRDILSNQPDVIFYQADTIISSNLHEHFTIDKLSRMAGTNQFKLKNGFRWILGMGVFHRLLFFLMERAKILLESTDKSIGEIAELAGYDTAPGFIHAFRREFGITPRE